MNKVKVYFATDSAICSYKTHDQGHEGIYIGAIWKSLIVEYARQIYFLLLKS